MVESCRTQRGWPGAAVSTDSHSGRTRRRRDPESENQIRLGFPPGDPALHVTVTAETLIWTLTAVAQNFPLTGISQR